MDELHRMDPTARFADRAGDYARCRPSYPPAAIDAILSGLPLDSICVADVGAGTGISTRLIADRLGGTGRVVAVEPNAAMRDAADPHPRITWHDGTAESTGLPGASADLVLCAQAFHWFRGEDALREFHRVLRPNGRLALMWNDRDPADAVTAEYGRLILAASDDHPAARRVDRPEPLYASAHFENVRKFAFPARQMLDADGLAGRARSASYVPREGARLDALLAGLHRLAAQHADRDGFVALIYVTSVYLADRARATSRPGSSTTPTPPR